MHASTFSLLIRSIVFFVILTFASFAPASPAAAQVSAPLPVLTSVTSAVNPPALVIRGEGFTPGGNVFLAIYDPSGEPSHVTRWTTASEPTFDMLGHDDPSLGYRPGGVVVEAFEHPCSPHINIGAYDEAKRTWTTIVDVVATC
jgi:hypothetical protein